MKSLLLNIKKFVIAISALIVILAMFPLTHCTATDDYFEYTLISEHDGYEISGVTDKAKNTVGWEVQIPNEIMDKPVVSIGERAFYRMINIETIIMGKNIDEIGKEAFAGCENIKVIRFNENLRFIQDGAFAGCYSLGVLAHIYLGYGQLKFPNGLSLIGKSAFQCTSIKSIVFGNSDVIVKEDAFRGCYDLIRIEMGSGKKTFEKFAFASTVLKEVLFPLNWTEEEVKKNIWTVQNSEYDNATKYYFSRLEPEKDENGAYLGNYWHYDNEGKVALW